MVEYIDDDSWCHKTKKILFDDGYHYSYKNDALYDEFGSVSELSVWKLQLEIIFPVD